MKDAAQEGWAGVGNSSARPPWFVAPVVERLRQQARDLEREARRMRALAHRVESPEDGVTVEYDGRDTLTFVGPLRASHSQAKGDE